MFSLYAILSVKYLRDVQHCVSNRTIKYRIKEKKGDEKNTKKRQITNYSYIIWKYLEENKGVQQQKGDKERGNGEKTISTMRFHLGFYSPVNRFCQGN